MRRRHLERRAEPKTEKPINFKYGVHVAYETSRDCVAGRCDGICRCLRIVEPHFEDVQGSDLLYAVTTHFFTPKTKPKDPLWEYCLERLLNRYSDDDLHVQVGRGYYGEEIEGVYLHDESRLRAFLSLEEPQQWVEAALTAEYGYVLPKLAGQTWTMEEVLLGDVRVPQENYRKLDIKAIERYQNQVKANKGLLSCLCDANLTLVDGYHRHQASVVQGKKKILVVHPTN